MRVVDEKPIETLHVYVVPEDQLPSKPDYAGIVIATLCAFILVGIVGLILVSPKSQPTVSFQIDIAGFRLPPVSKITTVMIQATGKGHVNATYAQGTITFYNGQTYTQIIPIGTILKGADNVPVITDSQAIIPPAAETLPPTYGRVNVPAHALAAGANGNIQAGDINEPCCVTSVIAQNPYNFSGGVNARDFTYLTARDVSRAVTSHSQLLTSQTTKLFPSSIVLHPTCKLSTKSNPAIGKETKSAALTLITVCTAISYSPTLAKNRIVRAASQLGNLSDIQFSIVGISEKKDVVLHLYVSAVVKPIVRVRA